MSARNDGNRNSLTCRPPPNVQPPTNPWLQPIRFASSGSAPRATNSRAVVDQSRAITHQTGEVRQRRAHVARSANHQARLGLDTFKQKFRFAPIVCQLRGKFLRLKQARLALSTRETWSPALLPPRQAPRHPQPPSLPTITPGSSRSSFGPTLPTPGGASTNVTSTAMEPSWRTRETASRNSCWEIRYFLTDCIEERAIWKAMAWLNRGPPPRGESATRDQPGGKTDS